MMPSPQLSNHITANIKYSMNDKGEVAQSKRKQEESAQGPVPNRCLSCKIYIYTFGRQWRNNKESMYELIWHPSSTEKNHISGAEKKLCKISKCHGESLWICNGLLDYVKAQLTNWWPTCIFCPIAQGLKIEFECLYTEHALSVCQ